MNGVQLYTIAHFGGDIVCLKIGSIITYVGGSTKLTSLKAHSSYEDFVTLLEETSKIRREDCKLYNFVHGCACAISSVQDFAVMINMHKTNPGLSTTKDTGSGRGLSTTKAGKPLRHNSFPDLEPEYRGYPETNDRGLDTRSIHLSNEPVLTNVPPSNEPILTNVPFSIEPETIIRQTEPSAEFWFEPQPEQVKDLMDFWFKSAAYMEDPYDFSKEFNIDDLYRDRIELMNHIRAYAVANKFNLEHVLSDEYKIVVHYKGHKCSWRIYATRLVGSAIFRVNTYCFMHTCIRVETEGENTYKAASSRWVASIIKQKLRKDPNYKPSGIIDDIQIHHNIDVTYNLAWRAKEKAHSENTDPVGLQYILGIPKETWYNLYIPMSSCMIPFVIGIRSFGILLLWEEAEKSQARLTLWATDHCKSKKFVADLLTYRVRTSRHHFQMTSYGRTDSVNIEDGTCSCRWWQTMGIPCEHGVRALGLTNVDPTTRVSEYYTNNIYKDFYKPIWIPIRGIEQWKILKTDPRARASIPIVRAGGPRTQRKRREKMPGLVTKLRFCSRYRKNGHNHRSCKLLPILSDDNTRPTMAPSLTMSTEPPVIPDEDVAISLH
ncbi:hypothetical protein GIB67_037084 [Kingdonia uniflora]|uniref:SWIM-type domain-containing protein n=1 Tax=Kingdonia uniflora TaxID=39325 RepID=A0A7J7LHP3_9MAGN|nr:hypothetical protein GIB67_037084 [Kingdonia uniflora]